MTNLKPSLSISTKHCVLEKQEPLYAAHGSTTMAAPKNTTTCTSAQDAEHSPTALTNVLTLRERQPRTPYKAETWEQALRQ